MGRISIGLGENTQNNSFVVQHIHRGQRITRTRRAAKKKSLSIEDMFMQAIGARVTKG